MALGSEGMDSVAPEGVVATEETGYRVRQSSFSRRAVDPRAAGAVRRRLERDLRAALAAGGLALHYQPRVALASGAIVAAEALLRWPHPRHGLISPATFIPIAERSDLVVAIGGYALAEACRDAMRWPAPGSGPAPRISVNVAARQLAGGTLIAELTAALGDSGLDPERLELELAEKAIADIDIDTLFTLALARDLGVGLVLDRFGAEIASLAILKKLPLTAVKLDRRLVRALPGSADDAALVRAIATAAHALGLTVIAEGIERESQRGIVAELGSDEAQGYLFSPPEPAAALSTRLLFATET